MLLNKRAMRACAPSQDQHGLPCCVCWLEPSGATVRLGLAVMRQSASGRIDCVTPALGRKEGRIKLSGGRLLQNCYFNGFAHILSIDVCKRLPQLTHRFSTGKAKQLFCLPGSKELQEHKQRPCKWVPAAGQPKGLRLPPCRGKEKWWSLCSTTLCLQQLFPALQLPMRFSWSVATRAVHDPCVRPGVYASCCQSCQVQGSG